MNKEYMVLRDALFLMGEKTENTKFKNLIWKARLYLALDYVDMTASQKLEYQNLLFTKAPTKIIVSYLESVLGIKTEVSERIFPKKEPFRLRVIEGGKVENQVN